MNKFLIFFCLTVIFLGDRYRVKGQDIGEKVKLSISTGRQREDFNWSIAGNNNGADPNVLSELKWKNVSGQVYSASFRWRIWWKVLFVADYNRVSVNSGSVSDMDYSGNNRTAPVYAENFSDNKGYTSLWNAGVGYPVFNHGRFSLELYAGYGENTQSLYLVDLTGQLPGLNSRYDANWKGGFIRVSSAVKIFRALAFSVDIAYNQVNYRANGNWNLIGEFQHPVSYTHAAKGYGIITNAGLVFNITRNIAADIGYGYFNWQTGKGNDLLYLSSGQVDKTRLNGVFRNGYWISGGLALSL